MTVPLPGPLHSHREKLGELADLGYTDIWSAEADGADGVHPAGARRGVGAALRLGTAIVPAYTRAPALHGPERGLAGRRRSRAGSRSASARRSNVIVERWNGVPFVEPYKKVRDIVRFLRDALSGEKVTQDLRHVRGQRLHARACGPSRQPPILVAAPARGHAAPGRPRGRRRDHQLAVGRRRADGGPDRARRGRRRGRGDRGPHLLLPERERRGRARRGASSRSPPT